MAVLQSTNVQGALCVNGVAVGGGKDFKYCCFTASTSFTPSQDLVDGGGVIDTLWVAGGGGGGTACGYGGGCTSYAMAGGGGGGEVISDYSTATATQACTVTIGAGGQSGSVVNGNTGIDSEKGGNTEFFGVTAYGGGGGSTRIYSCQSGVNIACQNNQKGGPMGGNSTATINFSGALQAACLNNVFNGASSLQYFGEFGPNASGFLNQRAFCVCCALFSLAGSSRLSASSSYYSTDDSLLVSSSIFAGFNHGGLAGFGRGGLNTNVSPSKNADRCGDGGHACNTAGGLSKGEPGKDGLVVIKWSE